MHTFLWKQIHLKNMRCQLIFLPSFWLQRLFMQLVCGKIGKFSNLSMMPNELPIKVSSTYLNVEFYFKSNDMFTFNPIGLAYSATTIKYAQVNIQVEKWTKIIHFIFLAIAIPSLFVPKLYICYYLYFHMSLGADSFELPLPFW